MSNDFFDRLRFSFLVDRYCKEQYERLSKRFTVDFLFTVLEYFDWYCEKHLPEHYMDQRPLLADGFYFVIFLDGFLTCQGHERALEKLRKKKSKSKPCRGGG